MRKWLSGLLPLAVALASLAQAPVSPPLSQMAPADPWAPLRFLVGTWEGKGAAQPGEVVAGSCTFAFELNGRALVRRNRVEVSPTQSERPSTLHEDLLVIYEEDGGFHALYVDNEGHAIRYRVALPSPGQVVFESEGGEKAMRFRLTHTLLPDGTLSTEFAGAPPGGAFQTYVKGITSRAK